MEAIEGTLRALELKLRDIRAFIRREKEAIPQVEAVIAACQLQRQHLLHISNHLPAFLPSLESPPPAAPGNIGVGGEKENARDGSNAGLDAAAAAGGKKKGQPAKRWAGTLHCDGSLVAPRLSAGGQSLTVVEPVLHPWLAHAELAGAVAGRTHGITSNRQAARQFIPLSEHGRVQVHHA
jgi:hypothetical protein